MIRKIALAGGVLLASAAAVSAQMLSPLTPANGLDGSLPPAFGSVALAASFSPDPFTQALTAGGPVSTAPVVGPACIGHVTAGPSFTLDYAGGGPLGISVESAADTILVVDTPDGTRTCNDDSGAGKNPAMRWETAPAGLYRIWVGSFREPSADATLVISATTDPIDPTPENPSVFKLPSG